MGHVKGPFASTDTFALPDERERNKMVAYADAFLCFFGLLTAILGIWLDGVNPFLVVLFAYSILMGVFSAVRFTRERDMYSNSLP